MINYTIIHLLSWHTDFGKIHVWRMFQCDDRKAIKKCTMTDMCHIITLHIHHLVSICKFAGLLKNIVYRQTLKQYLIFSPNHKKCQTVILRYNFQWLNKIEQPTIHQICSKNSEDGKMLILFCCPLLRIVKLPEIKTVVSLAMKNACLTLP